MRIIFIGMPGSGKTTMSKIISDIYQLPFYDLDELIENKHKINIRQLIKKDYELFRKIEAIEMKELFDCTKNSAVISLGGGTPIYNNFKKYLETEDIVFYLKVKKTKLITRLELCNHPMHSLMFNKIEYNKRMRKYRNIADYIIANNNSIKCIIEKIKEIIDAHFNN